MRGRIDSGGWGCWAVCLDCRWRGPRRAGNAKQAHEAARADLLGHYCQGEAAEPADALAELGGAA